MNISHIEHDNRYYNNPPRSEKSIDLTLFYFGFILLPSHIIFTSVPFPFSFVRITYPSCIYANFQASHCFIGSDEMFSNILPTSIVYCKAIYPCEHFCHFHFLILPESSFLHVYTVSKWFGFLSFFHK